MRTAERQKYILSIAQQSGFVSIPNTAKELGVSVETIRRDINQLCQNQLLKKVYGGAAPIREPVKRDADFMRRFHLNQHSKITISNAGVALIRDNSVVILDGGATTLIMAECIQNVKNVTFVITSVRIADVLLEKLEQGTITGQVIFLGGTLSPGSRSCLATPATLEALEEFHFDTCFLSCTAMSADSVSNTTATVYAIRKMMQRSSRRVLLVGSEKLGTNSLYTFAKPTDFDHIITDDIHPFPADIRKVLENTTTELTIVHIEE